MTKVFRSFLSKIRPRQVSHSPLLLITNSNLNKRFRSGASLGQLFRRSCVDSSRSDTIPVFLLRFADCADRLLEMHQYPPPSFLDRALQIQQYYRPRFTLFRKDGGQWVLKFTEVVSLPPASMGAEGVASVHFPS